MGWSCVPAVRDGADGPLSERIRRSNQMSTSKSKSKKAPSAKAKRFDREKAKVWGSPDYLKMKFDDIVDVEELSRFTADARRARSAVGAVSTRDDKLSVYRAFRARTLVPGTPPGLATIVRITLGLNGGGDQSRYFAALQRLTASGEFHVFDACVDAVDDLMDVLCTYCPKRAGKGE